MEYGLILIGAGPGDPELLTIKGLKALQRADVLLYDALAPKELLAYAPSHCKLIRVGKRAGAHSMAQSAINSLIVKYGVNSLVVRLKGGDPFVFGRGFEEIAYAAAHGIQTQVIPGISSAIAGPASVGIPITSRGISRSFWVVTATDTNNCFVSDIELACQSSATIVILMGINKLQNIVESIRSHRGKTEPIAIIHNATCQNEHSVIGDASSIEEKHLEYKGNGPGIIVVGEVVNQSKSLKRFVHTIKDRLIAA